MEAAMIHAVKWTDERTEARNNSMITFQSKKSFYGNIMSPTTVKYT